MSEGLRRMSESQTESLARECDVYATHINQILEGCADIAKIQDDKSNGSSTASSYLPLKSDTLLAQLRDGVVLAYLLHTLYPGCIKLSAIVTGISMDDRLGTNGRAIFEATANVNMVLTAARTAKLVVVNIGAQDIIGMNRDLVLGLLWQAIRGHLLSKINLVAHPELVQLLQADESPAALLTARSEPLLLRWVNYHLQNAGCDKQVGNFGKDLCDSECFAILMNQIAPLLIASSDVADLQAIPAGSEEGLMQRAERLLDLAQRIDCQEFVSPQDLVKGNPRLNLAFTATLFNRHIGIAKQSEDEAQKLQEEMGLLKATIVNLEETLETVAAQNDAEMQAMNGKLLAAQEQLEQERRHHEESIKQLRAEFQSYKDDLGAQYSDSLESTITAERRNHQEELWAMINRQKVVRRQLVAQISTLRQAIDPESLQASKAYEAIKLIGDDADMDELVKIIAELSSMLIKTNRDLGMNVSSLTGTVAHKEHVNEVMGTKIREFAEDLIKRNQHRHHSREASGSPSLRRMFSFRKGQEK